MNACAATLRPALAADWPAISALLVGHQLPLAGAQENLGHFFVAEVDGSLVGCVGLEVKDDIALLRSCAVDARLRGQSLGTQLTQHAIECARRRGIHRLVLLTTTAEDFFVRIGFARVGRENLPTSILDTDEFRGACPASATVMARDLIR